MYQDLRIDAIRAWGLLLPRIAPDMALSLPNLNNT
jgi:hypothetical protein